MDNGAMLVFPVSFQNENSKDGLVGSFALQYPYPGHYVIHIILPIPQILEVPLAENMA